MARFKDGNGREWGVCLDVFLVERVQDRTGVSIETLLADNMAGLLALYASPVKLVRLLWVICEDEAERRGVTPEQFGRAMHGDALEDAATAFHEALADFFPKRQRHLLKALAQKSEEIASENHERVMREIAALSASPMNSPESSGSTPAGAD